MHETFTYAHAILYPFNNVVCFNWLLYSLPWCFSFCGLLICFMQPSLNLWTLSHQTVNLVVPGHWSKAAHHLSDPCLMVPSSYHSSPISLDLQAIERTIFAWQCEATSINHLTLSRHELTNLCVFLQVSTHSKGLIQILYPFIKIQGHIQPFEVWLL